MVNTGDGILCMAVAGGGICGFRDGKIVMPKPRTGGFEVAVESLLATSDFGRKLWLGAILQ